MIKTEEINASNDLFEKIKEASNIIDAKVIKDLEGFKDEVKEVI